MKIAVTGGSGQIGRHIVKALAERGDEVLNLDRRQSKLKMARLVYVDLLHREVVQPVLEQVEAVIHLAEVPNSNAPLAANEIFARNTATGSLIFQTAADIGLKRVIYASSCQAYGMWDVGRIAPLRLPFDETHPLLPQNVYGLSKACNERYAQLVHKQSGMPISIFRMPFVMTEPPEKIGEHWLRWVDRQRTSTDGFETYVHVSDVVRAFLAALDRNVPGCEAYHLSGPEVMIGRPIREHLLEVAPDYPPLPEDWPKWKSPMLLDKARAQLGWEPQFNFLDLYRQKFGHDPTGAGAA